MKRKPVLIVSFILFLLSVCLPWFTYNPEVMGYRYGIFFLPWMIVPILVLGVSLFLKGKTALVVLSELSILSLLCAYIEAFGHWQEYCNIKIGYHWQDGLYTATVCYWLSLGLFLVFAVLFQFCAINREVSKKQ